jgi:GT2 family glycosyltransferase
MELTVVIPSFGLAALLRSCVAQLEASLAAASISSSVIHVVDNGSEAPYRAERFAVSNLKLSRLDKRSSFSKACNLGASSQVSQRYLFLNNDVLLHRQAIRDMMGLMQRPGVGICGARLVFEDDCIQHCGVRFGDSMGGPYHEFHGRPTESVSRAVRDFQAVTGAALLIDGALFAAIGGFDESFPFGYEDVDLCLRARRRGALVTCSQAVDSLHFESRSNRDPKRHDASRALFYDRWAGQFSLETMVSP